jgi:hypothetical protein
LLAGEGEDEEGGDEEREDEEEGEDIWSYDF